MKIFFSLISLFIFVSIKAQVMTEDDVELAIKSDKTTYFYNSPNGSIIDSIQKLKNGFETFIVVIDSSSNEWVKIKRYYSVPFIEKRKKSNEPLWLEIKHLESALQPPFKLYENPNFNSQVILESKNKILKDNKVNIEKIQGKWIKVIYNATEGWVFYTQLCPLKHTTCNQQN